MVGGQATPERDPAASTRQVERSPKAGRLGLTLVAPYMTTMRDFRTIGTLCELGIISEDEVGVAVEAFLSGTVESVFLFRAGLRLNLVKAVRSHPGAQEFVGRSNVGIGLKRPFVRAAILQARPMPL